MVLSNSPPRSWISLACFMLLFLLVGLGSALRPSDRLLVSQLRGSEVRVHMHLAEDASLLNSICGTYKVFQKESNPEKVCDTLPLRNLCDSDPDFCAGTLNYSRCEMPQVPLPGEDQWEAWVEASAADGITVKEVNISIGNLVKFKPSQEFLDTCKICSIAYSGSLCFTGGKKATAATCGANTDGCFCSWTSGISVSEDGHVLDGHHRWAAARILLEDNLLNNDTQAVVEYYDKENGTADIPLINETAAAHPELVHYTECAAEQTGAVVKSSTWRAEGFGLHLLSLVLVYLTSVMH